ncbi:hypothetical protein [Sphingosinithalassobacter portus]|uniref:hypothetical protein n=1 Tax=Stakelama portus TaxID=2676234 RepID=UPI000D6E6F5C|nr:hypothetical protein [Sphingosinithalassobacter portus]
MRRFCIAAICAAAWIIPVAHAQDGSSPPLVVTGRCETNAPLAGILRNRDSARDVAVPECNRAVIERGNRVTFFRGDRQLLVFRGHPGEETDITIDAVTIGDGEAFEATKGRCRLYGTPENGLLIVCFAVYRKHGANYGAVAMFEAD